MKEINGESPTYLTNNRRVVTIMNNKTEGPSVKLELRDCDKGWFMIRRLYRMKNITKQSMRFRPELDNRYKF